MRKIFGVCTGGSGKWKIATKLPIKTFIDAATMIWNHYPSLRRLPKNVLHPVVHGLVYGRATYGLPLYGNVRISKQDVSTTQMKGIQEALNDVLRFLLGVKRKDRVKISELLYLNGLPSINQVLAEAILTETFRARRTNIPFLAEEFTRLENELNTRSTRSSVRGDMRTPNPKKTGRNCFVRDAVRLWNLLPSEVRAEPDIKVFKRRARLLVWNTADLMYSDVIVIFKRKSTTEQSRLQKQKVHEERLWNIYIHTSSQTIQDGRSWIVDLSPFWPHLKPHLKTTVYLDLNFFLYFYFL